MVGWHNAVMFCHPVSRGSKIFSTSSRGVRLRQAYAETGRSLSFACPCLISFASIWGLRIWPACRQAGKSKNRTENAAAHFRHSGVSFPGIPARLIIPNYFLQRRLPRQSRFSDGGGEQPGQREPAGSAWQSSARGQAAPQSRYQQHPASPEPAAQPDLLWRQISCHHSEQKYQPM